MNFDSNPSTYTAVGSWVFFAVTFDNSGPGDAVVTFYIGGVDTPVSVASTALTGNVGDFKAGTRNLTVGNVSSNNGEFGTNRAFKGYIDNIGLWGAAEDGSGALTLAQLESLRQQQIQQIPEPSASAYLLGAFAGMFVCVRRRSVRGK